MSTGSGPRYSSITKNWFQSQLLRRRGPDWGSSTRSEPPRVLPGGTSPTPLTEYASSSELGPRESPSITPPSSPLLKPLVLLPISVTSVLSLDIKDVAEVSWRLSVSLLSTGWLAPSGWKARLGIGVTSASVSQPCLPGSLIRSSKTPADSGWGKTCCFSLGVARMSSSSSERPEASGRPQPSPRQRKRKRSARCGAAARRSRIMTALLQLLLPDFSASPLLRARRLHLGYFPHTFPCGAHACPGSPKRGGIISAMWNTFINMARKCFETHGRRTKDA